MINPYLKTYLITVQDNCNYRIDLLIKIITGFIFSYAQVAIWYAITDANKYYLEPKIINDTIKYIILSSAIWNIIFSVNVSAIEGKIRTGNISRDLIYPISLPVSLLFNMLGSITARIITNAIPSILVLTIIYRPAWNYSFVNILGLIIGLMLGFCINFLINFIVDAISFWWLETFSFQCIKQGLLVFLGGCLVPLWFYPQWLLKIINYLPFKNIIYVPIAFYLGNISTEQYGFQLLLYLFWIMFLGLLSGIIWIAGTKKLVVQGG